MGTSYTGKVVYVLNPDTVHIQFFTGDYAGETRPVRICGVDSYEERGKLALIGEGLRKLVYDWLPEDRIVEGYTTFHDPWARLCASVKIPL